VQGRTGSGGNFSRRHDGTAESKWAGHSRGSGHRPRHATAFIDEDAIVIATDLDDSKLQGLKQESTSLSTSLGRDYRRAANSVASEFGGWTCWSMSRAMSTTAACWTHPNRTSTLVRPQREVDASNHKLHPGMLKKGGGSIINSRRRRRHPGGAQPLRLQPTRPGDRTDKSDRIDFIKQACASNAIARHDRIAVVPRPVAAHPSAPTVVQPRKRLYRRQPMGRIGREEVASGHLSRLRRIRFISGHTHLIDGAGRVLGEPGFAK